MKTEAKWTRENFSQNEFGNFRILMGFFGTLFMFSIEFINYVNYDHFRKAILIIWNVH